MRILSAPVDFPFPKDDALKIVLYSQTDRPDRGSAGATAKDDVASANLSPVSQAWDFLSLCLSIFAADQAGLRAHSPDGWTREFDLSVALAEPQVWEPHLAAFERALAFLTTDRWKLRALVGGAIPPEPSVVLRPDEDCVALLSGGLDSLIGLIDLVVNGRKPFAVSKTVRGDAGKQVEFARTVGDGVRHLQLNDNARVPGNAEISTRARSLVFISFGVLLATSLARYHRGESVTLFICENGFISLNPALTGSRLGSLSTRTTHPAFLHGIQTILDGVGLRVQLENPYQTKTKGEMMVECADQDLLHASASRSTSCGRFSRTYRHCGRCVPCQVRRAAFLAAGIKDTTSYIFEDLGRPDADHAGSDDVRSVAMAIAEVQANGFDAWVGSDLSAPVAGDIAPLRDVTRRGLEELAVFHKAYGVK